MFGSVETVRFVYMSDVFSLALPLLLVSFIIQFSLDFGQERRLRGSDSFFGFQRESTANIKAPPTPYKHSSPSKRQNIIEFDCRGLEFTEFKADVGFFFVLKRTYSTQPSFLKKCLVLLIYLIWTGRMGGQGTGVDHNLLGH